MLTQENSMKTIFRLLSLLSVYIACFVLPILLLGCEKNNVIGNTSGVSVSDLPGTKFGTVVMNESDKISLLGWIHFDDIQGDRITGQWIFETWGDQPYFPMLPVNTGGGFPEASYISDFTGQVFGDMVIISIPMQGSTDSIGIVLDTQEGDELRGSVTLLPGMKFKGSIKALKKQTK